MKATYWVLSALALMAAAGLALALELPLANGGMMLEMRELFRLEVAISATVGTIVGAGGAFVVPNRIKFRPRRPASDFDSRVAKSGLEAMAITAVIAAMISVVAGIQSPTSAFSVVQSLTALITSSFASVPFAGVIACAVTFAVGVRIQDWGGRFSLGRGMEG